MTSALIVAVTVASAGAYAGYRRWLIPSCPGCGAKKWDRKLCRPLLFCRRCAARVDPGRPTRG